MGAGHCQRDNAVIRDQNSQPANHAALADSGCRKHDPQATVYSTIWVGELADAVNYHLRGPQTVSKRSAMLCPSSPLYE
jgi:hypothetical protein